MEHEMAQISYEFAEAREAFESRQWSPSSKATFVSRKARTRRSLPVKSFMTRLHQEIFCITLIWRRRGAHDAEAPWNASAGRKSATNRRLFRLRFALWTSIRRQSDVRNAMMKRIRKICPRRDLISSDYAQLGIADGHCVCDVPKGHQQYVSVSSGKVMETDGVSN